MLTVLVSSEDLEARRRAALLDLGGRLGTESLRTPACDAAAVPVVLAGAGQPSNIGRATRTVPDRLHFTRPADRAAHVRRVHRGHPYSA